ncbi:hypothetical protein ILUMI_04647, partial [Ignelater luminosus]
DATGKSIYGKEDLKKEFDDDREQSQTQTTEAELPVMISEVEYAIQQAKVGKANGPDGIPTEYLELLDEENIKVLTHHFNYIYSTDDRGFKIGEYTRQGSKAANKPVLHVFQYKERKLMRSTYIKKGVRLSLTLSIIYTKNIFKTALNSYEAVRIGVQTINNMRYAEDAAIMAEAIETSRNVKSNTC